MWDAVVAVKAGVKTLDDAPLGQVATVDQQRAFADAWRIDRDKR